MFLHPQDANPTPCPAIPGVQVIEGRARAGVNALFSQVIEFFTGYFVDVP
jgi:hypothetical protein